MIFSLILFSRWDLDFVLSFFMSSHGRCSKFENAISHKVHEFKSSAANDISIISIPIKNLSGKCCGQRKEKNTVQRVMQAVYRILPSRNVEAEVTLVLAEL